MNGRRYFQRIYLIRVDIQTTERTHTTQYTKNGERKCDIYTCNTHTRWNIIQPQREQNLAIRLVKK